MVVSCQSYIQYEYESFKKYYQQISHFVLIIELILLWIINTKQTMANVIVNIPPQDNIMVAKSKVGQHYSFPYATTKCAGPQVESKFFLILNIL